MAKIKVVTIGRLYCSGGSDIGRITAEKLGVKCYDHEIVDMAAERVGLTVDEMNKYEEAVLNPLKSPLNIFNKEDKLSVTEKIFAAETQIIYEITAREDCVIVGRCADFILKNKVKTLDVFIYSSFEKRMELIMNKFDVPYEEVESRLKKYDKKRADFYNTNTNKKWNDMHSYDMCLDSGKLGFETCAEIIADTVRKSK